MSSLLDVSVLIALVDVNHDDHVLAHQWFSTYSHEGWAACPITENGVVRIIGGKGYPNNPGSLAKTFALVQTLRRASGHLFWPDDLSLLDCSFVSTQKIQTPPQLTDTYLLALAVGRGANFVTLDRRIDSSAVVGGAEALIVLSQ